MTEWELAQAAIRDGSLVVMPTDTVYGIGCDPYRASAVADLLGIKGRGKAMPPPVLAADVDQALALADWTLVAEEQRGAAQLRAERLARAYWPGALTLIVPTSRPFGWDMQTHGRTVAVRVPDEDLTRRLLDRTGPLAVTSANLTGRPPALTAEEARAYFGDRVRCYLDGGRAKVGEASTIINCMANPPQVIRAGALDWEEIQRVIGGEEAPGL